MGKLFSYEQPLWLIYYMRRQCQFDNMILWTFIDRTNFNADTKKFFEDTEALKEGKTKIITIIGQYR